MQEVWQTLFRHLADARGLKGDCQVTEQATEQPLHVTGREARTRLQEVRQTLFRHLADARGLKGDCQVTEQATEQATEQP